MRIYYSTTDDIEPHGVVSENLPSALVWRDWIEVSISGCGIEVSIPDGGIFGNPLHSTLKIYNNRQESPLFTGNVYFASMKDEHPKLRRIPLGGIPITDHSSHNIDCSSNIPYNWVRLMNQVNKALDNGYLAETTSEDQQCAVMNTGAVLETDQPKGDEGGDDDDDDDTNSGT